MSDPIVPEPLPNVVGGAITGAVPVGTAPVLALIFDPNGNGVPAWKDTQDAITIAKEAITDVLKVLPATGPVFTIFSWIDSSLLPLVQAVVPENSK